jgi:AraC family transcriptional activator of pobA
MIQLFGIDILNAEQVRKTVDNPSPHTRNDYEEIIIITQGKPEIHIDFTPVNISTPVLVYLAQGRIYKFLPDPATRGWRIRFNDEFLPQSHFHFYAHFYEDSCCYHLCKDYAAVNIESLCEMLSAVFIQLPADLVLVRHLLTALLSIAESADRKNKQEQGNSKNPEIATINTFLQVVEKNYKEPTGIAFYAKKSNSSIRNLNRICQFFFEKSISAIVATRKMTEARKLIGNTNMTITEICFTLGYGEKSYFTRVFHSKTGFTPTEFRKAMKDLNS